jgi:hypothetical protein
MPDASTLGKWIVFAGLGLVVLGGLVWLAGRVGLPLGRLPGDLRFERGPVAVFLPCGTSILISLVLTLLLNLAARLLNR